PSPMELPGRLRIEPAGRQALVDLVHPLPILLHEADVERAGVFDFGYLVEVVQAQDEPRLVGQDGKGAAAPLRDAPEPEVGLEELRCPPAVGDGRVELIQTHGRTSSNWLRLI